MNGFGEVAERLRRSTVHVRVGAHGGGSGVILDGGGLVVTNAHVARAERAGIELWDGRRVEAAVTARDPRRDLAALRMGGSDLVPAALGDSDRLRVGELVIAVGNPLGFSGALTTGVVHALGPVRAVGREPWVQANVRLAPGNSGGPLADARGEVIGINTMIAGGLGLAVPSNAVKQFLAGRRRPSLGVSVRPLALRTGGAPGIGLLLLDVEPGGAAAAASLLRGDLLVGVDGHRLQSLDDLSDALDSGRQAIRVDFVRGARDSIRSVSVRLAAAVAEAA